MIGGVPAEERSRIAAMFVGEIMDRSQRLEDSLLALEQADPDTRGELLDDIARAAHTLKGSAAMMEAPGIATICHEFEDELVELRSAPTIEAGQVTELLAQVDRLREAGRELVDGADEAGPEGAPATDPLPPATGRDATAPARPQDQPPGAADSVRLDARKIDSLIARATQLRATTDALGTVADDITAARLELRSRRRGDATAADAEAWTAADRMLTDLDRRLRPLLRSVHRAGGGMEAAVRDAATVPISEVCQGLSRAARDIASRQSKRVELTVSVGDAEIDRKAVGVVGDALLHLVRNAVDHGIEPTDERVAADKPSTGTVNVTAAVHGDRVRVTVRDDGRGIEPSAVRAAAEAAGLPTDSDVHELLFRPGFSTAAETTEVSGRGVGLDAVRHRVESLGGRVTVASEPGSWTEVTLAVPATVATARVVIVEADGEQLAVMTAGIERLVRVDHDEVVVADGRSWIRREGEELVLLVSLADAVGLTPGVRSSVSERRSSPAILTVGGTDETAALLVDRVVGEQELLVQPLDALIGELPGIAGTGALARGRTVLLVHAPAVVRQARLGTGGRPAITPGGRPSHRGRILLAEDAPTTRALEQGLLEAAGYEVLPAVDGRAAWELLRDRPVDVVISDVEMPGMGGLELCRRIRSSTALRELPVVLVTSLDDDDARRRGADAGADAYLVKSAFAQGDLLATIDRLMT